MDQDKWYAVHVSPHILVYRLQSPGDREVIFELDGDSLISEGFEH